MQADPVQLESSQINAGMSGAAVLDVERNLIVGIVSETWFPDLSTKDRDTAWAVNGRVLTLDPLNLPVRDAPLPKGAAPQPKTDIDDARPSRRTSSRPSTARRRRSTNGSGARSCCARSAPTGPTLRSARPG